MMPDKTRYYIGIMTGNSMDAIDLVYAQAGTRLTPLAFLSVPFSDEMRALSEAVRAAIGPCQSRAEIEALAVFQTFHQRFIDQVATAVVRLILENQIDLNTLSAICFHGKTLDHCPPSLARSSGGVGAYSIQAGSGQMLADQVFRLLLQKGFETPIRIIYDFRSDDIMNGGEGAPLIPVLNAYLAQQDGVPNRIDINAGNTSNLCLIRDGEALGGWDLGPCNAYPDYLMRTFYHQPFDKDGSLALRGRLQPELLRELFAVGRDFYEAFPPKSGDPAFYHLDKLAALIKPYELPDCLHTAVYLSAYLMVYGLRFVSGRIPADFSLFGGGWNHPLLRQSFERFLTGESAFVLPEHQGVFADVRLRLAAAPRVQMSKTPQMTESLLMVLMGAYFDESRAWTQTHLTGCQSPTKCGCVAISDRDRCVYFDCLSRACKGWQLKRPVGVSE